ncbi:long-chain acyl-CoA synthetase [Antricoccus suffuscus]|uniref:Long-chain acyl-CoA synthetase n=1 Tax=Antricoccus suffuscus TaxID=1629062 RepID=A0A2T1A6I6_9ACTN|nr:long-chain-fatty-acid--CoA ligase [Antricoccus suffuscus]PRZ44206.1 long-chain acyl-CoA synthetase [Antricoccus suffuscus]
MSASQMLVSDIVAFTAQREPDQPALQYGDRIYSYASLADRITQSANALLSIARQGDRIAILAENRPEYVELYYSVPRAGMGLVFLNYRLSTREIEHIVRDSGAAVLITEPEYLEVAQSVAAQVGALQIVMLGVDEDNTPADVTAYDELLARGSTQEPDIQVRGDDLAWIIYTSGTTGRPKGAMLSHANLVAAACNSAMGWPSEVAGPLLFPWPLCHVAGYGILVTHLRGRFLVLMRRYDPKGLLEQIEKYQIAETSVAPTMFSQLLRHPDFDKYDVSSIRRIGYGAAPMPAEVLRQGMARFPNAAFSTGFGMTELSGNVLYHPSAQHVRGLTEKPELLVSVGRPMPLAMLRIVDDRMQDVATGTVGELVVRGPQVTIGYWNNQVATQEAFEGGWFHTGDLARNDDEGNWYIVDRKKDMILTGGENVYSREVEEVIYEHPAVAEAAVVGVPDETWGENVVAAVQLRAGATATAEEIIEHCRASLAGYKKPKRVLFVDELPRNAAGKILKRELRELAAQSTEE